MEIIIGADLVPTPSNYTQFQSGNIEELIDTKIIEILKKADYRIFNLEVPLTDVSSPISKLGPTLSSPTNTITGIKRINVDFFTLANNHILDHDVQGLESTMKLLKDNNVSYAGVGNIESASKPHFFTIDNIKVGVYCCCEHEFSVVSKNHIGANPFEPLNTLDEIVAAKEQCDYLIVLYHGGKEHYRYPSPNLQKTCRKIVEKGASLVVCQHSHCVGCEEKYKEGTIIYGQGNFLFDLKDNEYWNSSLLIKLNISKESFDVEYYPLRKKGNGVELAKDNSIIEEFNKRSKEITLPNFVEEKYNKLSNEMLTDYLYRIQAKGYHSFLWKVFNKLTRGKYKKYKMKKYGNYNKNRLINFIECEAHKELILNGLKNKK